MTGKTKIGLIVGALAAAVIALAVIVFGTRAGDPIEIINRSRVGKTAQKAIMGDEERRKYIAHFVEVSDLSVDPDTKSAEDGGVTVVPGLLRVTGVVENKGDEPVDEIVLILHPLGETNEVLSTYSEDIAGGRPLAPGQKKPFKFLIPEKKEYGGRFLHSRR